MIVKVFFADLSLRDRPIRTNGETRVRTEPAVASRLNVDAAQAQSAVTVAATMGFGRYRCAELADAWKYLVKRRADEGAGTIAADFVRAPSRPDQIEKVGHRTLRMDPMPSLTKPDIN